MTVHHGSLLFDSDLAEMAAMTTVDEYKIISKSIKSVRERVTNIREHLPPEHASMTAEEFKMRMVDGILLRCGGGTEYLLTPEDSARISEIAEEKFASREALYGRNPRFEKEKTGRFPGGKVCVSLKVERNRIADADLSGDFFAVCPKEELQAAIVGCPYERTAVLARLRERFPSSPIHGVTLEELAENDCIAFRVPVKQIDNTRAENAIRLFCVERRNRLFSGTARGAECTAVLCSVIPTAHENGLDTERKSD